MKKHKLGNPRYIDPMPPKQLKLPMAVFTHIRDTIGKTHAEQGGILGGYRETGEVNFFFFDDNGEQTRASYSPDVSMLNTVIKKHWKPNGLDFMGFVHTHPPYIKQPSADDEAYAKRILDALPLLPYMLMPIAMAKPDYGSFELYPYAAIRNGNGVRIIKQELVVEGQRVEVAKHTPLHEKMPPSTPTLPWGVFVFGGIGLLGICIATARALQIMRRIKEQ